MPFDPEDKRRKHNTLRRSIMDYGMGLVIISFGVFLFIGTEIGFEFDMDPVFRYGLGGLFIIYGVWRFYRGYQKKYYREE